MFAALWKWLKNEISDVFAESEFRKLTPEEEEFYDSFI